MDRKLKVYAKTKHLFAEFIFEYDRPDNATGRYIEYRPLSTDGRHDEDKSVFPAYESEFYPRFRQFASMEEIKAHDKEVVKQELGRQMTNPNEYTYVYEPDPILVRYVAQNHLKDCIGIIDIRFSFINNTKHVKFISGTHPRFDQELSSNSLESNAACIERIPVYTDRETQQISMYDVRKVGEWY